MKKIQSLHATIGWLLISGAALVLVPYTILGIIFDYPAVLRQEAGDVLNRFHQGGSTLIAVWFAFAITGLPLLGAYVLLGQLLEGQARYVRLATTLGVISIVTQLVGLLRWTFVVPILATIYTTSNDPATRAAATVVFQAFHQFGGVLLGEHIGQLFTIVWTVVLASALVRHGYTAEWVAWFGYGASAIYLVAQAELFQSVIPAFPVWEPAGFLGSTLWLVWLIIVGVVFLRKTSVPTAQQMP